VYALRGQRRTFPTELHGPNACVGGRRDQFAQLVERVYLDFDANYHTWLENMDKAFASWKQANQPV
jgi:hypothetical protein